MKSIDVIDALILVIFGASLVVPTFVADFGLDPKLTWIPVIFYAIWIMRRAFLPSILLPHSPELAVAEKIRGLAYVFSLAFALIANFLMLSFFPRRFLWLL